MLLVIFSLRFPDYLASIMNIFQNANFKNKYEAGCANKSCFYKKDCIMVTLTGKLKYNATGTSRDLHSYRLIVFLEFPGDSFEKTPKIFIYDAFLLNESP